MALPEVGRHIRQRRLSLGLTQPDIRPRGGPTKDKVLLIEKGEVENLTDRTKLSLAAALEWPSQAIDWLIEGDDPASWWSYKRVNDGRVTWERSASSVGWEAPLGRRASITRPAPTAEMLLEAVHDITEQVRVLSEQIRALAQLIEQALQLRVRDRDV